VEPDVDQSHEAVQPVTPAAPSSKRAKKAAASQAPDILSDLVSATVAATKDGQGTRRGIFGIDTRLAVVVNATCMLAFFVLHCTWVTSNAYSSPSVVLASMNQDGSQHIIDDFREAYYWLRQNTPETSVVMSWWDYGYQIAGMADRPTLVDNNTWNNSKTLIFYLSTCQTEIRLSPQPILQPSVKPCLAQKKSLIQSCGNTTWTTF
jgi:dolichyl-diphosphooligosaccharide--protein glycosyltransferase